MWAVHLTDPPTYLLHTRPLRPLLVSRLRHFADAAGSVCSSSSSSRRQDLTSVCLSVWPALTGVDDDPALHLETAATAGPYVAVACRPPAVRHYPLTDLIARTVAAAGRGGTLLY